MSRRYYSSEEKAAILDHLATNYGDVIRTARERSMAFNTLYRWRKEAELAGFVFPSPPSPPIVEMPPTNAVPLSRLWEKELGDDGFLIELPAQHAELIEALRSVRDRLLKVVGKLSLALEPAIEEANLAQRVTALSQLIDRVAKIDLMLPVEEEDSQEIRFADSDANEPEILDDETAETVEAASPSADGHRQ